MQSVDLKTRSDIHYARKIWHISTVLLIFFAYVYLPPAVSSILLTIAWCLCVPFDFIRQKNAALNDWALHAFRPIMRQTEAKNIAGTSYLLTGVFVVHLLFPRSVVTLTILFLALADPIASYFGILYGKDKIFGNKSIQGFIAAFVVCFLSTAGFIWFSDFPKERLILVSLFSGIIGAVAEIVPIGKMDDNLTLPVISATGLTVLFYFFGFFTSMT